MVYGSTIKFVGHIKTVRIVKRNYRNDLLGDVFKQYYGIRDVTYQQKQIEGGRHR